MQIAAVADGIFRIPIPVPIPLRWVNCYALKGPDGWTLVDTGFHDPGAEAAWREAMGRLGIRPGDVEQILVTHYHPDHLGAAGWLQAVTGAPVVRMPERDAALVPVVWDRRGEQAGNLVAFLRRHGMPAEVAEVVREQHLQHGCLLEPLPARLQPIADGEELRIGGRRMQAIWMPGHSEGLMVFLDLEDGLCLLSDMLLMKITPNVALWPWGIPDPLAAFLESLDRMARLPVRLGLTGHRDLIPDVPGRAREIREHHARRLEEVRVLCRAAGPRGLTGWELSRGLFGDQSSIHNQRFAMAEALAHAEHLVQRGELVREEEEGGTVRYRLA